MGRKLFVGNLAYGVTDDDLQQLFSQAGTCESASVVMDGDTGQSRGFAFVMMASAEDAARARKQLEGTEVKGRGLAVDEGNAPCTPGGRCGRPGGRGSSGPHARRRPSA